jgi:hypothetical protein
MKTVFKKLLEWLIAKNPGIASTAILVACAILVTGTVKDFQHRINDVDVRLDNFDKRLTVTEYTVKDINERQLPEIRAELVGIKLFMKKIDTYLFHQRQRLSQIITVLKSSHLRKMPHAH